ncbi:C2H2 transcription factor RfeC [Beauveria brongniartii RCEF 3172]|uniref:C2H2 transcription factor RfeC n=1 Tax=Beauveria brongniartii RCEF 3172 TaxID=1081107 RepID=A0A166RVG5_9HYPO|nr:C2H2 transcription factor RfeC [Beauveria brongniartii RCEF 3172]
MSNTPYSTVGLEGNSNPHDYPPPLSFSPYYNQLPQTLRPLQPSSITTMQPLYGSNPHTPRTGTPNTPNSAYNLPSYPQSTQASARRDMHSIAQKFWSPHIGYGSSQPMTTAAGTLAAKNTVRNADGRFPCPECTKTFLHTKHLKRHFLRHTGERPYKCAKCNTSFYRADILKRHFQKCSIRNPTAASHLSHPVHVQDGMNGMPSDQPQLSRSSSMGRVDSPANGDQRGSQPNRGIVNSTNGQNMHGYNVPPGQRGMPMYGAENNAPQSSLDWAQMFPPAGP